MGDSFYNAVTEQKIITMLNKKCPYCRETVSLEMLKQQGTNKALLNREVIPCPHCHKPVQLPAFAEKLVSVGLLLAVILAPLTLYWWSGKIISYTLLLIGLVFIVIGITKNQLQPVTNSDSQDEKEKQ
jgi:uncharacterized protein YbaR (Trm112 family)